VDVPLEDVIRATGRADKVNAYVSELEGNGLDATVATWWVLCGWCTPRRRKEHAVHQRSHVRGAVCGWLCVALCGALSGCCVCCVGAVWVLCGCGWVNGTVATPWSAETGETDRWCTLHGK
jgi:hypothetical protein